MRSLLIIAIASCVEPTSTVVQHEDDGPIIPSLHVGTLSADTARIGTNMLHDVDGIGGANALAIESTVRGAGAQLAIYQDEYSNPATMIGGIVPGSDRDPTQPNYGTFQGLGTTFFKFPIGLNGQTFPRYTLDILSDEHDVTNDDWKIKIGWASSASFDTPARQLEGGGIYAQANLTHNAGEYDLIATGLHARASIVNARGGDAAYAIWSEEGKNRLDGPTTIGKPDARVPVTLNSDHMVVQSLPTSAQPGIDGTLVEVRTGGPRNYVSFGNPDASTAGFVFNNDSASGDAYVVYKHSTGFEFGSQNATRMKLSAEGLRVSGKIALGFGAGDPTWTQGDGSPEGVVAAAPGSLYSRTDATAGPRMFVKEAGAGATGWVAK